MFNNDRNYIIQLHINSMRSWSDHKLNANVLHYTLHFYTKIITTTIKNTNTEMILLVSHRSQTKQEIPS